MKEKQENVVDLNAQPVAESWTKTMQIRWLKVPREDGKEDVHFQQLELSDQGKGRWMNIPVVLAKPQENGPGPGPI